MRKESTLKRYNELVEYRNYLLSQPNLTKAEREELRSLLNKIRLFEEAMVVATEEDSIGFSSDTEVVALVPSEATEEVVLDAMEHTSEEGLDDVSTQEELEENPKKSRKKKEKE